MIFQSVGVFGLLNPSVTRDCGSLMIYVALGAVGDVESMRDP
jgi:hypothetical protein